MNVKRSRMLDGWNKRKEDINVEIKGRNKMARCLCGCGQEVSDTESYVLGHESDHSLGFYTPEGIKELYKTGLLTSSEIKRFKDKGII